ncbi:MAG: hypothetical protein E6K80_08280, partial [Candidatus Eisenbacteria bacterium]
MSAAVSSRGRHPCDADREGREVLELPALTSRFTSIFRSSRRVLLALALATAAAARAHAAPPGVSLLAAGPGAVRFGVDVQAPSLAPAGDPSLRELRVPGYQADGRPGDPALPECVVLVAVPPSGDVSVTAFPSATEWHDDVRLTRIPFGEDVAGEASAGAARARRSSAGAGAQSGPAARLLEVTWLRDQRVARVLILPATYDPASLRLGIHRRIEVEVRFASTPAPSAAAAGTRLRGDGFESVYRDLLVNPEQGRAWREATPAAMVAGRTAASPTFFDRLARRASVVPDTSVFAGRKWVKIAIPQTGFYRVYFGQLRNSGLFGGSDTVPLDSLRLFV